MNDLAHASTLFLVFSLVLVAYGALIAATGDKNLIPNHAIHSIKGRDEVRRVGRIVVVVGVVIGAISLIVGVVSR